GAGVPGSLRHRRRRPPGQPVGGRDRRRAPAGQLRRTPDDPARPPLRGAPGGPVRTDHDVCRARHGRRGDLGEPGLGGRQVTTVEFPNEVVTKALVRYVTVPGLSGEAALITLDNGFDHTKPNSLGPAGLASLEAALDEIEARTPRVRFIAITGKPFVFCVGADITGMPLITRREDALAIARRGHQIFARLRNSDVPTFAFINGAALGGGLELALHCHYRTLSSSVTMVA